MSTPRRNRQQRFVRAVVYILVLALAIGLIATMVGTALASPARAAEGMAGPAASIASPASSASSALAASVVPAASAAPEAMADQPAAPDQPTAPDDGRPSVVVLGTVDLTWADLLAAADSDDAPLAAAARTILTYAGGGEPVDLVTRTVGDGTCPADGWLTLGAGSRLRAAERAGDGSAGCRWPADWAEAAGATPGGQSQAGSLTGVLRTWTPAAIGRGGVLALTNGGTSPIVGDSPTELLARDDPPDLIVADTVPQPADPGAAPSDADPSDADRILALAAALESLADAPPGTRVVVASVADAADPGPQMAILPEGTTSPMGTRNGFVVGTSTHQPGLIQLTDLTPTLVLAASGLTPGSLWSRPLEMVPGNAVDRIAGAAPLGAGSLSRGTSRARALADDALHARASQRTTVPMGLTLVGTALVLALVTGWALRAPRGAPDGSPRPTAGAALPAIGVAPPSRRRLRVVAGAACPVIALPLGIWFTNTTPWWRAESAAAVALGTAIALAAALVVVAAGLGRAVLAVVGRRRPQAIHRLLARLGVAGAKPDSAPGGSVSDPTGRVVARAGSFAPGGSGEARRRTDAEALGSSAPGGSTVLILAQVLVVLTATVILVDAALGTAPLAFNGPLGMNAVVAGRFYGMSNTGFALAAAALLVAIAAWGGPPVAARSGYRERRRALAVGLVAAPGLVALLLDAAPETGADVGGALTLVPALVALGAGLAGARLRWQHWVAVGAVAVGLVLLLGLSDFLSGGSRTHLGRFINQMLMGDAGATITRKATALVEPFTTSRLAAAALVVGAGSTALATWWAGRTVRGARQGRGPYAWLARPGMLPEWLGPLGRALTVLVVVEVLVNDSGLTMLCFSAAVAVPALIAILTSRIVVSRAP